MSTLGVGDKRCSPNLKLLTVDLEKIIVQIVSIVTVKAQSIMDSTWQGYLPNPVLGVRGICFF